MNLVPTHIVIHTLAFEGDADIQEVRDWHKERGFDDVGYHFLISRKGCRQIGRAKDVIGAHARSRGFNHKSLGVALEGHGDYERWTLAQTRELLRLCHELMDEFSIPIHSVIGHRETGAAKTCPGTLIEMGDFRGLLMDYLPD